MSSAPVAGTGCALRTGLGGRVVRRLAPPPQMALAGSRDFRRFDAAQPSAPIPTDRLDDPSHCDLRQHATPSVPPNRTDRVLRRPVISRGTDT